MSVFLACAVWEPICKALRTQSHSADVHPFQDAKCHLLTGQQALEQKTKRLLFRQSETFWEVCLLSFNNRRISTYTSTIDELISSPREPVRALGTPFTVEPLRAALSEKSSPVVHSSQRLPSLSPELGLGHRVSTIYGLIILYTQT